MHRQSVFTLLAILAVATAQASNLAERSLADTCEELTTKKQCNKAKKKCVWLDDSDSCQDKASLSCSSFDSDKKSCTKIMKDKCVWLDNSCQDMASLDCDSFDSDKKSCTKIMKDKCVWLDNSCQDMASLKCDSFEDKKSCTKTLKDKCVWLDDSCQDMASLKCDSFEDKKSCTKTLKDKCVWLDDSDSCQDKASLSCSSFDSDKKSCTKTLKDKCVWLDDSCQDKASLDCDSFEDKKSCTKILKGECVWQNDSCQGKASLDCSTLNNNTCKKYGKRCVLLTDGSCTEKDDIENYSCSLLRRENCKNQQDSGCIWNAASKECASPTKKPTKSPTKSPTKRPTKSPTKRPAPEPTCPKVETATNWFNANSAGVTACFLKEAVLQGSAEAFFSCTRLCQSAIFKDQKDGEPCSSTIKEIIGEDKCKWEWSGLKSPKWLETLCLSDKSVKDLYENYCFGEGKHCSTLSEPSCNRCANGYKCSHAQGCLLGVCSPCGKHVCK